MNPHPWQSARDDFDHRIVPLLQKHGKQIGASAQSGDETAKSIMENYQMLYRSFDPLHCHMLDEGLSQWLSQQKEDKEREEFEKRFRTLDRSRDQQGDYADDGTQFAWTGWQAARKAKEDQP